MSIIKQCRRSSESRSPTPLKNRSICSFITRPAACFNKVMPKMPDEEVDYVEPHLYLHNMVINCRPENDSEEYDFNGLIEQYLDESDDHELNQQDSKGRTALHVAVEHSNVGAIAGLLMCGADVNVADYQGKTPFTYCLETYEMPKYECNQMFYTFLGHVHKLIVIGLRVSEENRNCYTKARARHVFNDKQLKLSYDEELDKMEDVMVDSRTSLRQVFLQGPDAISMSRTKRWMLEEIYTASDFCQEFPKLCCLLKLQYRRGMTRAKLIQPTKNSLAILLGISLPDPCTETIIKYLDDEDVMNLMKAGLEY